MPPYTIRCTQVWGFRKMNVQKMVPFSHSEWLLLWILPPLLSQTSLWQPSVVCGCVGFPEPVQPALTVSPSIRLNSWQMVVLNKNIWKRHFECALRVSQSYLSHTISHFDLCNNDFTILQTCVFRMLRGASMMQDFPILTWTNNLESLWVNSDAASLLVRFCVSEVTE